MIKSDKNLYYFNVCIFITSVQIYQFLINDNYENALNLFLGNDIFKKNFKENIFCFIKKIIVKILI
jgi:hypothetical protein